MIPITKPFLPPVDKYQNLIKEIWERNQLTNMGPLVRQLEDSLKKYLKVDNLLLVSSGTTALQITLKVLDVTKEVITTPFSYVATTSSIIWSGATPVFVDIDKKTFNIDPTKIEAAITPNTQAILATHCFGNPCNIQSIELIAKKHNLKVIYDAAHCFGTKYKGKSIFSYGDISITSFHATKLFHTIEGGAIVSNDIDLIKKCFYMHNFGHDGPGRFNGVGINGKNSEFHAAMGIINLEHANSILENRRNLYFNYLKLIDSSKIELQSHYKYAEPNFSYFPIVLKSTIDLEEIVSIFENHGIQPRRYFFPSLNQLDYVKKTPTPVSELVSSTVLCLPMYYGLSSEEQSLIVKILLENL